MKAWLLLVLFTFAANAGDRVVSIGGDVTQIVYALGAQQLLVARDSTSLHPAQAATLPDVGYMRQLNAEGILALKPTLVLTSALAKPSLALEQIARAGVKVVMVPGDPHLAVINTKVATIAKALHKEIEGQRLTQHITQLLSQMPQQPLAVKVLFIMNHSGMNSMAAGTETAADAAIRSAGLINAMSNIRHYQPLSQEGVVASAPQLVVVGESGVQALGGENAIWRLPGLALTPAGKARRLLVVDDMALLGFGLDTPQAILRLRQAAQQVQP
ncbi:hemin ABC transporter substrate-binding protein [Erwinia sp. OLTSP20]|uniref:heme/hemin ABC transporter substrate-binding protein n=1 Tax=unclassified Erwinia TaxID=2622719 RepID=UPI000C19F38B|nr:MULTISPECIES: ABC transporter substrate-binding protein [unclassified Erwinia]PIJ50237.1 hemin ABC transporter substrate-binding protein [Erwinia sp. OAMSP11]PIJ72075.1 hemin ABC transporter substrate-binding protein [Erwinia sp. OLSSP12]PIJ81366.1 hemin ABC transporter substrate-binding protein [Erwinia sp. OLCASP19]PIJ84072.1 hemin ABC transporter substrate-binding protein [Erwinia sp. OLMTSP26]PIJ85771.1 hemin ABC transporter substrate-binding protein [Erwinia sp. OLMDSP33]